VRQIDEWQFYREDFKSAWMKLPFRVAQTSPNLDRIPTGVASLSGCYDTAANRFVIPMSGVYELRVQVWYRQDHNNKAPLNSNWNFTGKVCLRLEAQDANNYLWELTKTAKLHMDYLNGDEITIQDISYLNADWKVWAEICVDFPNGKDGQLVIPPRQEGGYPSSFKLALIS